MSDTITIVSGFGRCGSSLVMQMLHAGGMPTTGRAPSFEAPECGGVFLAGGELDARWLASARGHAIKILDPHRGRIPRIECRVIWLDRDRAEQAKSQAKFFSIIVGMPVTREMRRRFAQSYLDDKPKAVRSLLAAGAPSIFALRFEDVLRDPRNAADEINRYCGENLDAEKMASVVRRRSSECAPDLAIELALMGAAP